MAGPADETACGILRFLGAAAALKDTLRNSWTASGRQESVAEHSWRLCLAALTLEEALPEIDVGRLLRMLIVHDLGEAVRGDVPAPAQAGSKSVEERSDFVSLVKLLPQETAARLLALWDEYERAETAEARIAKALDKVETCLQHVEGSNPPGFDYDFNLRYGRQWDGSHPLVDALRALVDARTLDRARAQ